MKSFSQLALALGLIAAVAACSPRISTHGHIPDVQDIATIQPGVDTRQDVAQRLGSPSTLSSFEQRTWLYIGQKIKEEAFFEPEVIDQTVFVVNFDSAGTVEKTKFYTLHDGQIIDPVTRETPTEGQEITVLQQIFGNFGRLPGALGGAPVQQ